MNAATVTVCNLRHKMSEKLERIQFVSSGPFQIEKFQVNY